MNLIVDFIRFDSPFNWMSTIHTMNKSIIASFGSMEYYGFDIC